jgi:hypothetical protein
LFYLFGFVELKGRVHTGIAARGLILARRLIGLFDRLFPEGILGLILARRLDRFARIAVDTGVVGDG